MEENRKEAAPDASSSEVFEERNAPAHIPEKALGKEEIPMEEMISLKKEISGKEKISLTKETSVKEEAFVKENTFIKEDKYTETNGFVTPPGHLHFRAKKLFGPGGEIEGGAIAYLQPGGGGPVQPHTHPHDHLFIVVAGEAKVMLGEEIKTIRPDEAFRVKGSIPHSVWNAAQELTVMIGLTLKAE